MNLSPHDLEDLRASGLSDETIRTHHVRTEYRAERITQLLGHTKVGSGLVFRYFDEAGEPNCYARVKPHRPRRMKDGKLAKYEAPVGQPNRAYILPSTRCLMTDPAQPVYVTEGEKKTLALYQLGLVAVGVSGGWCWKVKDKEELLPDLAGLAWSGREVFIVFDHDPKPDTQRQTADSAKRLAKALQKAGAKDVCVVDLPPGPDGAKCGVDDFLVANGTAAAAAFKAIVDVAKARTQRTQRTQNSAQILLGLALADAELWHTPDDVGYATIDRNGVKEHWRVRSKTFREWLNGRFYASEGNVVGSATVQSVVDTLEAKAKFDGQSFPLSIRVGGHGGKVYIDLADDRWRAVEVDESGWRVIDRPPVRFRRTKGTLALPEPVHGGSVDELRKFVNVIEQDWPLLLAWLVSTFRPAGPYPILKLYGEQGSAKTTTAEVLRKNIDPNVALLRRPPTNERDLMISAQNGWVCGFDNLSHIDAELSDALCCVANGGGFSTRQLYSDEDETIIVAERPILLNGIEDVGVRSDLLDRSIVIELPRIEAKVRKAEDVFWAEFDEARPRILGALLDAVSVALRRLPDVKADKSKDWPRMMDFAQWATAAEPGLGLDHGAFLEAHKEMKDEANKTALESCPVAAVLLALLESMDDGKIKATATDLLGLLNGAAGGVGVDIRAKGWPKSNRPLSGILQRLAPNLRAVGVNAVQSRPDNVKVWVIERTQCTHRTQDSNSSIDEGVE